MLTLYKANELARLESHIDHETGEIDMQGFDNVILPNGEVPVFNSGDVEYQLRAKPLKQVSWSSVPAGVAVIAVDSDGENACLGQIRYASSSHCVVERASNMVGCNSVSYDVNLLKLAPASEQPWLPYIQGKTDLFVLEGIEIELLLAVYVKAEKKQIEVITGYPLSPMQHEHIKAYRIIGLAEGYELK